VLEQAYALCRSKQALDFIAWRNDVGVRTVRNWLFQFDNFGISCPLLARTPKGYSCLDPQHLIFAKQLLHRWPFAYPEEVAVAILSEYGVDYSSSQVYHALRTAGITRKTLERRAREQNEPLRVLWMAAMSTYSIKQVVFFDETHANAVDVRRKYGYSSKGEPAFRRVYNAGHGTGSCCALAALALDGMLSVTTVQGAVDHIVLLRVLREEVLPLMDRYPSPRSVLAMDNASTHDHAAVHNLCATFGVRCLFIPPHSYDLNPIEPSFHEGKQDIITQHRLDRNLNPDHLQAALVRISTVHAVNYCTHCGYTVTDDDRAWAGL
jgi:transposase